MSGLLIRGTRSSRPSRIRTAFEVISGSVPLVFAGLILLSLTTAAAQQLSISTVAGNGQTQNPLSTATTPGWISGIAVDPSGNVYLSISDANQVMKLSAGGSLTVFAGTGTAGFSGDRGLATSAELNTPVGIALDSQGNLYIADSGNQRVREVLASTGQIDTVAGNGTLGQTGDGGMATNAELANPVSVAIDGSGNLYILELGLTPDLGPDVRVVSSGTISTLTAAFGFGVTSIAVDSSGNVYSSVRATDTDPQEFCIVGEFSDGEGFPVAGNGTCGYNRDGILATDAELNGPLSVAVDSSGNVYIADADNNRIRQVSAMTGLISTVAGNGTLGISGDGGPATNASLVSPGLVAVGPQGSFYIVDSGNQRVRKVSSSGVITTLIGNVMGSNGDGGPAINAMLSLSPNVAVDSSGNFYIAETDSHVIRKVSNQIITTFAGNGTQGYSGDHGPATSAQLSGPLAVTVAPSGDVYIADTGNNRVRKVSNGIITTVAGNGTIGFGGDGGPATGAQLKFPTGLVVDTSGNLYISDTGNQEVRKVNSGGIISTIAGTGVSGNMGDGGPANRATLNGPAGLALDSSGNLYIADSANSVVRKIAQGIINTVAGLSPCCRRGFAGDGGPATNAQLNYPVGVAVDSAGNLYIADAMNQRIREVSHGVIKTIAGNGTIGFGGDGGPATDASLAWPSGIAVASSGNVFVADTGNRRIRELSGGTAPTCSPIPGTPFVQASTDPSSPLMITVSASCTDSSGTITSVTINWGDGTPLDSGPINSHTYTTNGPFTVTLTATNNFGQNGSIFQVVTFPQQAPPVFAGQPSQTNLSVTAPQGTTPMVRFDCTQATGPNGQVTNDPQSMFGITCTFSPETAQLSSMPVSVMLTVQTTGGTMAVLRHPKGSSLWASLGLWTSFPFVVVLIPNLWTARRKRSAAVPCVVLVLTIAFVLLLSSCGGGFTVPSGSGPPPVQRTPAGNYLLTVSAIDMSTGFTQTSLIVPLSVTSR